MSVEPSVSRFTMKRSLAVGLGIIVIISSISLFSSLHSTRLFLTDITNTYSNANINVGNHSLHVISQDGINHNDKNFTTSKTLTQAGDGEASNHVSTSQYQQDQPSISTRIVDSGSAINITLTYRKSRAGAFYSWYDEKIGQGTDKLLENADQNGTILDFIIAGFPKCGTSTMMANLGHLAPMPVGDICAPPAQTVYYAYKNWVRKYGGDKILKGSKCPAIINDYMGEYSKHIPRTKVIIGIRHPVLWFQSFWNMQLANKNLGYAHYDPYFVTKPCAGRHDNCRNGCPHRQLVCLHRGRFHVQLAAFGKTALSSGERKLLAPNDFDGGKNLLNENIRNPVFLYEQSELGKDYVWDELAKYLNVTNIPHDKYVGSHGRSKGESVNFCEDKYDDFRAMMMPYAYELSVWMQDYFIPVARNESSDVTIASPDVFTNLVKEYRKDPCNRLFRVINGTYVLHTNKTTIIDTV